MDTPNNTKWRPFFQLRQGQSSKKIPVFLKKTEIGYPQQPQMTSFFSASWSLESLSLHHVWEGQFLEKIGVFLKKIRKLKKGTSFATFFIFTAGLTAPYREFRIGNFKIPVGNSYREFFEKKQTKIPIGIPYREFKNPYREFFEKKNKLKSL